MSTLSSQNNKVLQIDRQLQQKQNKLFIKRLVFMLICCVSIGFAWCSTTWLYNQQYKSVSIQSLNGPETIDPQIENNIRDSINYYLLHYNLFQRVFKHPLKDLLIDIKQQNPLIHTLQIKNNPNNRSELVILVQKDYPWIHFDNGWVITLHGRLLTNLPAHRIQSLPVASKTIVTADNTDLIFWQNNVSAIKKLVISVNNQLPEKYFKQLNLQDKENIQLVFNNFNVNLGVWDENIITKRVSRLFAAYALVENPQNLKTIHLNSNKQATVELK